MAPLHLLDFRDEEVVDRLYDLLGLIPEVIWDHLDGFTFPETMRHQPMKLSASGQVRSTETKILDLPHSRLGVLGCLRLLPWPRMQVLATAMSATLPTKFAGDLTVTSAWMVTWMRAHLLFGLPPVIEFPNLVNSLYM